MKVERGGSFEGVVLEENSFLGGRGGASGGGENVETSINGTGFIELTSIFCVLLTLYGSKSGLKTGNKYQEIRFSLHVVLPSLSEVMKSRHAPTVHRSDVNLSARRFEWFNWNFLLLCCHSGPLFICRLSQSSMKRSKRGNCGTSRRNERRDTATERVGGTQTKNKKKRYRRNVVSAVF